VCDAASPLIAPALSCKNECCHEPEMDIEQLTESCCLPGSLSSQSLARDASRLCLGHLVHLLSRV